MLGITRINHTAFRIDAGAGELEAFYRRVLGVPVVERDLPDGVKAALPGFWIQLGQTQTHFIEAPASDAPRYPMGPHLAFYVEDIELAAHALSAADIDYDRYGGVIFFSDPAGTTIELQQDPQEAPGD